MLVLDFFCSYSKKILTPDPNLFVNGPFPKIGHFSIDIHRKNLYQKKSEKDLF